MFEHVLSVKTLRMKGFCSPKPGQKSPPRAVNPYPGASPVCDLNDRVDIGLREDAFPPGALDIEAQDSQRRDCAPVAVRRMRDNVAVSTYSVN